MQTEALAKWHNSVRASNIRGDGCVLCDRLPQAVDSAEKDLHFYQQFEGVHPGAFEKINSTAETLKDNTVPGR